jgi:hypothetical protein
MTTVPPVPLDTLKVAANEAVKQAALLARLTQHGERNLAADRRDALQAEKTAEALVAVVRHFEPTWAPEAGE